jgi:hypothetical protein
LSLSRVITTANAANPEFLSRQLRFRVIVDGDSIYKAYFLSRSSSKTSLHQAARFVILLLFCCCFSVIFPLTVCCFSSFELTKKQQKNKTKKKKTPTVALFTLRSTNHSRSVFQSLEKVFRCARLDQFPFRSIQLAVHPFLLVFLAFHSREAIEANIPQKINDDKKKKKKKNAYCITAQKPQVIKQVA